MGVGGGGEGGGGVVGGGYRLALRRLRRGGGGERGLYGVHMRWWFPLAVSALLLGAGATRVGSRRLMATIRSRRLLAAEPPAERQFDGHPVVSPATLLHPHTDFAQRYWTALLKAGDTVIDATVGNGHDAAVLAEALGRAGGGTLLCVDAQAVALERSQERLRGVLAEWQLREGVDEWLAVQRSSGAELVIRWAAGCHRTLPLPQT